MRLPPDDDRFMYDLQVEQDETVTFEVTPFKSGPRARMAEDGSTIPNTGDDGRLLFAFMIEAAIGGFQFARLQCQFVDSDAETARFEVAIKGSRCGRIDAPAIRRRHKRWHRNYVFEVVESSC